jgi:tetratricopeptide (TPR) repeat protein
MPAVKECHTPDTLIGRLSSLMRLRLTVSLRVAFAAAVLGTVLPGLAHAAGMETDTAPLVDPSRCESAITANDDDRILAECGALIDNEKTAKADLIKALIARAGVFARKDQIARAIADYDSVLRNDPTLADIYNTRGELWWKKGDRPRALADFAAAIKLNPDHAAAKGNYKSLAQELERLGALMAVAGKPSFDCATARRGVEKAICANPELADLDREINAVNTRVVRAAAADSPRAGRALQQQQDEFLARRNASFGRADYDLQKAMRERLDQLLAIARK